MIGRMIKQTGRALVFAAAMTAVLMVNSPAVGRNRGAPPQIEGCPLFPADHVLNARIDALPVHARSADYVASIGANTGLHPDFGTVYQGAPIGIPFIVVPETQAVVPIRTAPSGYPDQNDSGPMPIPPGAPIEGAGGPNAQDGDRHVLVLQRNTCKLFELGRAFRDADNGWTIDAASIFDLRSNALRPDGWTSSDAAGLAILPALVRYDDVKSGEVTHAVRFSVPRSSRAYVWPARHFASDLTDPKLPPMGARFRLKAGKDISTFPVDVQVIFTALKRYGMIVADNGSPWYVTGAPDPRWDDDMLVDAFAALKGSDFEAVDVSSLQAEPDSARVKSAAPTATAGPSPTPFVATVFVRLPVVLR